MIVSPDEMSASNAPSTSPLKHCDMKLPQLTTWPSALTRLTFECILPVHARNSGNPGATSSISRVEPWIPAQAESNDLRCRRSSGVCAELAAERVRLLHQRS